MQGSHIKVFAVKADLRDPTTRLFTPIVQGAMYDGKHTVTARLPGPSAQYCPRSLKVIYFDPHSNLSRPKRNARVRRSTLIV